MSCKEGRSFMDQYGSPFMNNNRLSVWDLVWAMGVVVVGGTIYRAWLFKGPVKGNPTNWPLLGMLPALLLNLPNVHDWLASLLINNGGSFSFQGPWVTTAVAFITADPRNIEHALRTHFHNFPKGKDSSDIFHDLLGNGIFNADDGPWKFQRKAASLQLNSLACRRFTDSTVFDMVEKKLLPTLQHFCDGKKEIDFQDLMLRFTFDTVCLVSFGFNTGCLTPELPVVPFAQAFETALECTCLRFLLPPSLWQALKWLRLGKERSMPQALKIVNEFSDHIFSSRKKELKHTQAHKSDLLTCFLRMNGAQGPLDDKLLKDIAINFLLAGRDTSALALSWFFWLLAKHPDVEEKAAREAQIVISAAKEEGKPFLTRMELGRMHYLHAALTESLRLYPSVPTDVKQVVKDDVLPDGTYLRKDDKFMYSMYAMGRMESIWGPDCTSFKPERWLDPADGTFTDSRILPFHYIAFNAGPRTCLGKDMAYLLMKTVASTVLFHFRVILVPGYKVVPKLSITLYIKNGLHVHLEPRNA